MTNYIYIIADLKNSWINTTPFFENKNEDHKISLQMIRDISINFLESKNTIIKFSLYRIKETMINFLRKRENLLKHINIFSPNYAENYAEEIGFEKMNDFEYIVDESKKTQMSNGFQIMFSYTKNKSFGDKIYLSNPNINFSIK